MSPKISLNIFVYFPKSARNHSLRSASPRQEDHPRDHSPLLVRNVQSEEEGKRWPQFSRRDWPWETVLRLSTLWSRENCGFLMLGPSWPFLSCRVSVVASQPRGTRLAGSPPPALSPPPPRSLKQTCANFEAVDCVFRFIYKCFSNVYPKEGADFSWNMDQFCISQTPLAPSDISSSQLLQPDAEILLQWYVHRNKVLLYECWFRALCFFGAVSGKTWAIAKVKKKMGQS